LLIGAFGLYREKDRARTIASNKIAHEKPGNGSKGKCVWNKLKSKPVVIETGLSDMKRQMPECAKASESMCLEWCVFIFNDGKEQGISM
jgi:hypothetical protein